MNSCVLDNHAKSIASVEYTYNDESGKPGDASRGSGFLISPEGHIITAAHVLRPPDQINQTNVSSETVTVQLRSSSSEYPKITAQIIKRDSDLDIALLKIPTYPDQPRSALPIGDSSAVHAGDPLTGLGFPMGGDLSIISTMPVLSLNTFIQGAQKPWWETGLALNPGDSGGPIFGPLGTVVGIAVAYRSGATLISYVLPIQYAHDLLGYAVVNRGGAVPCKTGTSAGASSGTEASDRLLVQHLMDFICSHGVLQNDYSWELPGPVRSSIRDIQTTLENTLGQLAVDSAARQPIQTMQSASRAMLQNPMVFPSNLGARPISPSLRQAIHDFRTTFYENTTQLVTTYTLTGNCDLSRGL